MLAVRSWEKMISRCTYQSDTDYKNYGAKGINVEDPRWFSFNNFLLDMGDPPIEVNGQRYTLDRKDNNKGYSKDNCRWATSSQQARNRSTTSLFAREGVNSSAKAT